MPDDLEGKIIVTNTVTKENIEELRVRKVSTLVTTTPEFNSRSFGTNVIEAIMLAILKKPVEQISNEEYIATSENLGFKPRVIQFR